MEIVYKLSEEEIANIWHEAICMAAKKIAEEFMVPIQMVISAFERLAYPTPFNVEEMKEAMQKLVEQIKDKCRADCSTKPIIKPPYWHRIRSYCVTNKYH